MRSIVKLLAAGAAAAVAITIAGLFALGRGAEATADVDAPKSTFSVGAAHGFGQYPLYNVGDSFEGLPLVAVLRNVTTDRAADYVSFIYGDCQAASDLGCAPPLEVQVWPACIRNPSLYAAAGPRGPAREPATVRGVPAEILDDGGRLELQTGTATVVVFGSERAQVERAGQALRGVNVRVDPADRLPAPARGARDGTLRCD